jgi:hypothetical protein
VDQYGQWFHQRCVAGVDATRKGNETPLRHDELVCHATIEPNAEDHGRAVETEVVLARPAGFTRAARREQLDSHRYAIVGEASHLVTERDPLRSHVRVGQDVKV